MLAAHRAVLCRRPVLRTNRVQPVPRFPSRARASPEALDDPASSRLSGGCYPRCSHRGGGCSPVPAPSRLASTFVVGEGGFEPPTSCTQSGKGQFRRYFRVSLRAV